jgi:16S rRNA (adenine1518-N6/adenine1519-N6)-dimethyltransferase
MFQREVDKRICAGRGSKIYGILSVLVQAYYKTENLFTVSERFFPRLESKIGSNQANLNS